MEETKNFRHIVKVCALLLCVLFFVCPLVEWKGIYTASGWEIATDPSGKKSGDGYPLVFALIIIPAVLLVLSFTNNSFVVLRNVSIVGLIAKIIFLIAMHREVSSSPFMLTGNNWLILFIYAGLVFAGLVQSGVNSSGIKTSSNDPLDLLQKAKTSSNDPLNLLNKSNKSNKSLGYDPLKLL